MVFLDLLKGDCLQVMQDLSSNTVDCFICDLPYGCLTNGNKTKSKVIDFRNTKVEKTKQLTAYSNECSWDIKIDLHQFWEQVKRLAKNDHTPVLMFCTTKFGYELIKSNESWFRYDLVWDKQRGVSFLSANKMPMRSHEMIYVFSKSGAFYNRIDENGRYEINRSPEGGDGIRCVKSVIQLPKAIRAKQHPTEKPLDLYKWLIERYCPKGGTILDPTAGSFNSCFASYELDRNSIGIEMDNTFYTKACERADNLNP
jgi:DNA modification methylase